MILYIPLLAFLIWSVYSGDVTPREGGILTVIFLVLNGVFFLLKLSPAWYIVSFVMLTIYLIVKVFGGDIKIR